MDKFLSYKFNIDAICIELMYTDGSTLSTVKINLTIFLTVYYGIATLAK